MNQQNPFVIPQALGPPQGHQPAASSDLPALMDQDDEFDTPDKARLRLENRELEARQQVIRQESREAGYAVIKEQRQGFEQAASQFQSAALDRESRLRGEAEQAMAQQNAILSGEAQSAVTQAIAATRAGAQQQIGQYQVAVHAEARQAVQDAAQTASQTTAAQYMQHC